jgi:hypothetical protein
MATDQSSTGIFRRCQRSGWGGSDRRARERGAENYQTRPGAERGRRTDPCTGAGRPPQSTPTPAADRAGLRSSAGVHLEWDLYWCQRRLLLGHDYPFSWRIEWSWIFDNGIVAGGTIGGNYQAGLFVFGAEGDFDWDNIKGNPLAVLVAKSRAIGLRLRAAVRALHGTGFCSTRPAELLFRT